MNTRIRRILDLFEQISRIPRCSKNEQAITRWFEDLARHHGWSSRRDPAGNLRITVPATPGCELAPTVVLQGHLDMRPNDGKRPFPDRAAARAIALAHRRISEGAAGVRGAAMNPTAGRQALGEMVKRYA